MKSMMQFMKTMMIMPIHWQVWLGVLVTANMVVPFFFINTLEAQVVLPTAIVGLVETFAAGNNEETAAAVIQPAVPPPTMTSLHTQDASLASIKLIRSIQSLVAAENQDGQFRSGHRHEQRQVDHGYGVRQIP